MDTILTRAQGMAAQLVAWRRALHAQPELSWQESATATLLARELKSMGLPVREGVGGGHGLVADLETGQPGPRILLRADMDALPLQEATGQPFASLHPGVMHACGHDAHMTCLLGAARLLTQDAERLRGAVRFVFQPAEEVPPGGALGMIEGGVLEGVQAAAALHVYPALPVGQVGFRPGAILAYSNRFVIRIQGTGGHAAKPHLAVDALATAVQVYQGLQYLVSRENDPLHPFVITIGRIQGGSVANVIADQVELEGTVRCLDAQVAQAVPERIQRVAQGICQSTRATCHITFQTGYPALINDPALTAQAAASARKVLGSQAVVDLPHPEMGGEDFAFFAQRVPAVFFRLGVSNPASGKTNPLHHPAFDLDEGALPVGTAVLVQIAQDWLERF